MSAWKPIDTAPRDGTACLLWSADFDPPVFVGSFGWTDLPKGHEDYWEGWVFSEDLLSTYSDIEPEPTHWMPFPAPPEGVAA